MIGKEWKDSFGGDGDVLVKEIRDLIEQKKAIIPLLVDDAELPDLAEREASDFIQELFEHQGRTLDNATWPLVLPGLIRDIERLLREGEQPGEADAAAHDAEATPAISSVTALRAR